MGAELSSWQVSPRGEIIAGNQVATSFMVPHWFGFDVMGLTGWGLDLLEVDLKLPRTIREA